MSPMAMRVLLVAHNPDSNSEQVVTHQPAISFSISFQHPFNRAGGRTSNVVRRAKQGASCQVKDLMFQNLASRNYRVLQS